MSDIEWIGEENQIIKMESAQLPQIKIRGIYSSIFIYDKFPYKAPVVKWLNYF